MTNVNELPFQDLGPVSIQRSRIRDRMEGEVGEGEGEILDWGGLELGSKLRRFRRIVAPE